MESQEKTNAINMTFSERTATVSSMPKCEPRELDGQLWEPCPKCYREPVYLSLNGYCVNCG